MKLRIKGDSLRLRLTQGEVTQFADSGEVEDQLHFGGDRSLIYRLRRSAAARELGASFVGTAIEVQVPERAAREWCDTNAVTLERGPGADTAGLRIVVEKDFACLAPRDNEDESDNFPHPEKGSQTC